MAAVRSLFALLILWVAVTACEAEPIDSQAPPPGERPLLVKVGVVVVDLHRIDDVDQNFEAAVIVRLAWRDPRLVSSAEAVRTLPLEQVWSPRLQISNEIRTQKQFRDVVHVHPDGTVVYMQRYAGRFSTPLDLRAFPFDKQRLRLRVTFPDFEPEQIEPIPDPTYTGMLEGESNLEWVVGEAVLRSDPIEPLANVSRASAVWEVGVERRPGYYLWKIIAPMVLIVFMSWTVFWISPENAGAQIGVATSSMLTLIAYRFILGNLLPRVPYLTQLDLFTFGATLLVFLALLTVVLIGHLAHVGRRASAQRADLWARALFPLLFVLLIVWVFWGQAD